MQCIVQCIFPLLQVTKFQKSPTIMLANNKTESYFNFNPTAAFSYPQPPKTRRSRVRGGNSRGAQFSFKNSEPTPITSQIKPVEVIDYINLTGQYYSSNSKVISGANHDYQEKNIKRMELNNFTRLHLCSSIYYKFEDNKLYIAYLKIVTILNT